MTTLSPVPSPVPQARLTGAALVAVSAVVFSTAGIFTNGVAAAAWTIIFWRGVAAAAFTLAWLGARGRLGAEIRAFGGPALLVAVLNAAGTAAFIPAFKLAGVADVVLIYAAVPFAAAGLSWALLREAPSRVVLAASAAAFAGVLIIVSGSLGRPSLAGDALAMVMTAMMAGVMVVYRARPATTAALPSAASSLMLLPVAALIGDPLAVAADELPALAAFGLVFAVASVTLSEGARRLPSAEAGLISTLEVPLAPLFAWAILAEIPSTQVLWGGALIFAAALWSQLRRMRASRAGRRQS